MSEEFTHDVFLSYTNRDKNRVGRLAERLRSSGLRVWFDQSEIKAGENIFTRVGEGLTVSRTLVLCMSEAAFKADWVMLELSTVMFRDPNNRSRRFVPLRLDDSEIPAVIRPFKYIDFRKESDAAWSELLAACSPLSPKEDVVLPLHVTEDRFLQLLLYRFSMRRHVADNRKGVDLRVCFNDDTPAIWNQQGKRYIRSKLPKVIRSRYQRALDDFLINNKGDVYKFNDALFPFRYASGGTLPVINFKNQQKDYYCLFYRDVHPIGWNIANGGTDSREELLDPAQAIERELREELVVADFENNKRYVFTADVSKPIDHPAHAVALRLWSIKCPEKDLRNLDVEEIRPKWEKAPDTLHVQFGSERPIPPRGDFYLNINGEDFGIEFDRVARIELPPPPQLILFDGEIDGGHLVNSPVGLFEVSKFNERVRLGQRHIFKPDFFFFGAEYYKGSAIDSVLRGEFLNHLQEFRTKEEIEELRAAMRIGKQYGLCPVTERLVRRILTATA